MDRAQHHHDEARFEHLLGNLLRGGVFLAAVIVLIGGSLYVSRHGSEGVDRSVFHGEPADLRHPGEIAAQAFHLGSAGLIQAGLQVLVATPVVRVLFSVIAFLEERDFTFVVLTLVVLAVLLYSVMFRAAL
jgi:uncharacterized membrane protein